MKRKLGLNIAKKFDDTKPKVELLPSEALLSVGNTLGYGAKKYGANNWRSGMEWSRMYGAAMRHLLLWNHGEDKDVESGQSHLSHAICCLLFLLEYSINNIGEDNRYRYAKNN